MTVVDKVRVLAGGLAFPEGPAFDPDGDLWCVELEAGNLVRIVGEHLERHQVGGRPNGLAFDGDGRAWFCDAARLAVRCLDPSTGKTRTLAHDLVGEPLNKPNDLAFDARGRLVFTCPGDSRSEPTGYVCCVSPDGKIREVTRGMYFPNGLAFVDEGRSLVVAETYQHRIWKGDWDAVDLRWSDPQPFASVGGPVGPDGMALGADGLLYVAVFGQGCVKAVDATGHVGRVYRLPGIKPTNVAFDPSGELGLVVTEAQRGLVLSLPNLGPGVPPFDGSITTTDDTKEEAHLP